MRLKLKCKQRASSWAITAASAVLLIGQSHVASAATNAVSADFEEIKGTLKNLTHADMSKFEIVVQYDCQSEFSQGVNAANTACVQQVKRFPITAVGAFTIPAQKITTTLPGENFLSKPIWSERIALARPTDNQVATLRFLYKYDGAKSDKKDLTPIAVVVYDSPAVDIPVHIPGGISFTAWMKKNGIEHLKTITAVQWSKTPMHDEGFTDIKTSYKPMTACLGKVAWKNVDVANKTLLHVDAIQCVGVSDKLNGKAPRIVIEPQALMSENSADYIPEWVSRIEVPKTSFCTSKQKWFDTAVCVADKDFKDGVWAHPPLELRDNADIISQMTKN